MKQLKFMLAAAAAFGIATAQADQKFKDTFEADTASATLTGYKYVPTSDNDNDNESAIVDGGYNSSKALKVNTGTNPLLRALEYDGQDNKVSLAGDKPLYIDTMVQFTVTPHGDSVTVTDSDKLMIYLKEDLTEGNETTNLVIRAAAYDADNGFVEGGREYTIDSANVEPNVWYRLVVKAQAVALSEEADAGYWPVFQVCLGGDTDDDVLYTTVESGLDAVNDTIDYTSTFVSLQVANEDGEATDQDTMKLQYVGFAGEGKVDDLAFGTVGTVTPVDFTLALGEGVSAVSYTVGNTTGKLPDENGAISVALNGISVTLSGIEYAPGYEAGNITAKSYQAENITVDANKKNIVTEGDTPTTGADIGFTGTPFADFVGADLQTVVAWAGAGHVPAATVQKMSFNNTGDPAGTVGSPERIAEEAYLLGCSPAEVEAEKKAFVFPSFAPDMTPAQMKAAIEADKSYNGTVVIEGATTLSDENGKPNWATGHDKPAFYRARLIFE